MTHKDFALKLLLLGWQSSTPPFAHDEVEHKWHKKECVLTQRKTTTPPFVYYRNGREISSHVMIATSLEFNNIYEVMDFLEREK